MGFDQGTLFQCMTFALLEFVFEEEINVHVSFRGKWLRIQIYNAEEEILMTVYGEAYQEAAQQLVLACLQRMGVPRLRELHKVPLKKGTRLAAVST